MCRGKGVWDQSEIPPFFIGAEGDVAGGTVHSHSYLAECSSSSHPSFIHEFFRRGRCVSDAPWLKSVSPEYSTLLHRTAFSESCVLRGSNQRFENAMRVDFLNVSKTAWEISLSFMRSQFFLDVIDEDPVCASCVLSRSGCGVRQSKRMQRSSSLSTK